MGQQAHGRGRAACVLLNSPICDPNCPGNAWPGGAHPSMPDPAHQGEWKTPSSIKSSFVPPLLFHPTPRTPLVVVAVERRLGPKIATGHMNALLARKRQHGTTPPAPEQQGLACTIPARLYYHRHPPQGPYIQGPCSDSGKSGHPAWRGTTPVQARMKQTRLFYLAGCHDNPRQQALSGARDTRIGVRWPRLCRDQIWSFQENGFAPGGPPRALGGHGSICAGAFAL